MNFLCKCMKLTLDGKRLVNFISSIINNEWLQHGIHLHAIAKWIIRHSLKIIFSCWWLNCRPMIHWPTPRQLCRDLPKAETKFFDWMYSAFGSSLVSWLVVGQHVIGRQLSHQHEKRLLSEWRITHFANGADVDAVQKSFANDDGADEICQSFSRFS